jgi:putative ABC transport system ATP-binding protein
MGLEEELLRLGAALVRVTLEMIKETDIDEFFFQNNPMEQEEHGHYEDIIRRLDNGTKLTAEEKNKLMIITLRYIPAKHDLIVLGPELRRKILLARFYFLSEIQHIDTSRCELDGDQITHDGELRDFSTYCHAAYLYNRNIRTNILLGSTKKTNDDIMHLRDLAWDTFRRYGLLEEIIDIGLDFFVGSQGSHLSGGQKQKVAIARALLKDTPIIIMDEATASLDNTSQALIQDYFSSSFRSKKTIIAVIHRLDLTPSYDRILVMDNGTIVEDGDFDSLIENRGIFYELYHLNHA